MEKNSYIIILLSLLWLTCSPSAENESLLSLLLTSIENLALYYEEHLDQINLDGVYGLRIMEGKLKYLCDTAIKDPDIKQRLTNIYDIIYKTAGHSIQTLKEADPQYLNKLEFLVNSPQLIGQPSEYLLISPKHMWNTSVHILDQDFFSEEESDHCHSILSNNCSTTDECLHFMFTEGAVGYVITHQLLYSTVIQQLGCTSTIEKSLLLLGYNAILQHQRVLCTNTFFEIVTTLRIYSGEVPLSYHDLFMEQLFVCPMLGYMEFVHDDWTRMVIGWQTEAGCYSDEFPVEQPPEANTLTSRKLLRDKVLIDRCSSHMMAVAMAMLSECLHFKLIPGPQEYSSRVKSDGINYLRNPNVLLRANYTGLPPKKKLKSIYKDLNYKHVLLAVAMLYLIYRFFKYIRRYKISITYRKYKHMR